MNEILEVAPNLTRDEADARLDALALQYHRAGRSGVQVVNLLGAQAENLLAKLPEPVRDTLEAGSERALHVALAAASQSRRAVPDQPNWMNTMMGSAMGAAGGFGGLAGTLVELPATVTLLMRSVQGVAQSEGFDPQSESVKFDCVRVFSSGGPLAHDDATDLGFLSVKLSLSGKALSQMIAAVAPKLAVVMGQKLAAQTVPVLGAVAGASVNFTYVDYYQRVARVHFGLRRLAIEADVDHALLLSRLQQRLLKD
ncbi:MAG: EcsC family protein [Paracoccaceae bacterium]